jgi:hypothetical protein
MQPDMLEIMYTEIKRNNCDLAICHFNLTREDEKPIFRRSTSYGIEVRNQSFIQEYREHSFPLVWNKLYRKSAIENYSFDPKLFTAEDGDFNLCVAKHIKKYVIIDAEMYGWRQYNESCSKSKFLVKKRIDSLSRWLEKVYNSSYDFIPLSLDQKCIFFGEVAAANMANTLIFSKHDIAYVSCWISDLYSRSLIDLAHTDGILKKILMASFVIIGKMHDYFIKFS